MAIDFPRISVYNVLYKPAAKIREGAAEQGEAEGHIDRWNKRLMDLCLICMR